MEYLLDEKVRLIILLSWLFIMLGVEFIMPLVNSYRWSTLRIFPNIIMMVLMVATNFLFASVTLQISEWVALNEFGLFYYLPVYNFAVEFILGILFLDFWAAYLPHILMHKIPLLWRFHSVHHSDEMVDVTTAFRQHPLETILRISFHLSGMILLGAPLIILLGYLTVSSINAQIEHANIRLNKKLDSFLQLFYVTPNMHKVHHAKQQIDTDSNYSNIFSIWDRLFGTYRQKKTYKSIEYGLDYISEKEHSVKKMLFDIPIQTKKNQKRKKTNETNA